MNITINALNNVSICPYCLGSGKLKTMQSASISNSMSIRANDTEVKCKYCDGAGFKTN